MDLLKLIRENSDALAGTAFESGIAAVIRHVERAETYLLRGRKEQDVDYFNDVVYRTNQAYEGILKEAYALLAGKDVAKLRTVELEGHFAKEAILSARVAEAFQEYRRDWRNPSTHDHRLSFTEQDATLALSTISTFVYLLVDQMIGVRASQLQKKRSGLSRAKATPARKTTNNDMELASRVARALMDHAVSGVLDGFSKKSRLIEILGTIHGYLSVVLSDVDIEMTTLERTKDLAKRPDMIIRNGGLVVIEVKRFNKIPGPQIMQGLAQLERHLEALKARHGILYSFLLSPIGRWST